MILNGGKTEVNKMVNKDHLISDKKNWSPFKWCRPEAQKPTQPYRIGKIQLFLEKQVHQCVNETAPSLYNTLVKPIWSIIARRSTRPKELTMPIVIWHWKHLRNIWDIYYPKTISNYKLYQPTNTCYKNSLIM